ncbi:uncharacterized protein F4807DRAFT_426197 [Annulohypoxylon truncatum]|uniref:uncharacterized protein n=1 Tax=Annulohypoxylon truncatum TaxID=327061 RepID=UPI0020074678|nr:uncharacterized protein F4807DRAFT_426197 [Annulohypoxylon truncatum]KAI1209749.1 hypothetical protein F4807DRAFT_426197 [Annulohypoxylon truncatum]
MNTGAINHPNYGQIGQEGNGHQTGGSIQIDPALRSGMAHGPYSTDEGTVPARTPGSRLQRRPNNQAEEATPNNVGNIAGLTGNSIAGNQATTSVQPRTAEANHSLEPLPAAGANINYHAGNFSFENPGYNHGLDSACLNQPLVFKHVSGYISRKTALVCRTCQMTQGFWLNIFFELLTLVLKLLYYGGWEREMK